MSLSTNRVGILLDHGLLICLGHLSVYVFVCVVRITQFSVSTLLLATFVYSNCSVLFCQSVNYCEYLLVQGSANRYFGCIKIYK